MIDTELKERIEAFKRERLGDKIKTFVETVTAESVPEPVSSDAMDTSA